MNFDARRKKFDRDFERTQKAILAAWAIGGVVAVCLLSSVGYVIIRVLSNAGLW